MRSKLERIAAVVAAVAFAILIAARAWGAPGYDLSALAVAAKVLDDGHASLLYEHNPTFYNLADSPEIKVAARELGFLEYAPTPFVQAPLVAYVARPLARARYATLLGVWNVLAAAATVLSLWLALRLYAPSSRPIHFVLLLAALVPFEPIAYGMWLAQTTPLVVLAMLAALALVRRGREGWAGALLALPVFVKLTPIVLAVVWVIERRWRALAGLGAALVALAAASLSLVGVHANVEYVERVRQIGGITLTAYNNHSLVAVLTRLARPGSPELFTMVTPPVWAKAIVVAAVGGAIAIVWRAVRGRVRGSEPELEAFTMLAILLVPSIAWTHYFVLLVPVVLLVLERAGREAKLASGAAIAALLPCTRPIIADYTQFQPRHPGWMAGPTVGALLAFGALLAVALRCSKGRP